MTPAKPAQLPLGFDWRPAFGRENFLVAPGNARALAALEGWRDWRDPILLLTGPEGAGKTHLAALWRKAASAHTAAGAHNFEAISAMIASGPVVLEDADRIGDETLVFHAINAARESGRALLITARTAPPLWAPKLPDLASRLAALHKVALAPPDEAFLGALIIKLMADRQMVAEPKIVDAILGLIPRSFAAARQAVADLDTASLAEKRPLTQALVRRVLAEPDNGP